MKRRVISFVVCIVLVLSMFVMPVSALASSGKYMKAKTNVNLRKSPNGDKITSVKKGDPVWFTGVEEKAFYQVVTKKGDVGYIFKMYLTDNSNKVTRKTPSDVYVVKSNTELRKKNSTSAGRVCRLNAGRYVEVLKTQGDWAYVRTAKNKKGFILKSYLKKPD